MLTKCKFIVIIKTLFVNNTDRAIAFETHLAVTAKDKPHMVA